MKQILNYTDNEKTLLCKVEIAVCEMGFLICKKFYFERYFEKPVRSFEAIIVSF